MSLRRALILCLCSGFSAAALAQSQPPDRTPIEATTAGGDKVLLHPNGRWEFVDTKKADAAKKTAAKKAAPKKKAG